MSSTRRRHLAGALLRRWHLRLLRYYRKGNADLRVALLLAAGFLVGGYFAPWARIHTEVWLRRIFALTLIGVGGRMFFSR